MLKLKWKCDLDLQKQAKSSENAAFILLVDVIYSLLHASNQLYSASKSTIFKSKFGCLSRKDDVKEVKIRSNRDKNITKTRLWYDKDLPLEARR